MLRQMSVKVNPAYEEYRGLIEQIPYNDLTFDKVYKSHRNLVGRIAVGRKSFVIKKYKRPTWANCMVYTWFRKNKAQRAYENALYLLENGIETAPPVAYIVTRKYGFFHTAWFVSEYLPYMTLDRMYHVLKGRKEREQLSKDFINFTLGMHRKKLMLLDNNPGNTLVYKQADGYHFAIVDINRLQRGKTPTVNEAMRSFEQLNIDARTFLSLVPSSADSRGLSIEECAEYAILNRKRHQLRHRLKHALKRMLFLETRKGAAS